MSEAVKRINPRRPFIITPEGLKRITLGEVGEGGVHQAPAAHHGDAPKPRRLSGPATAHLLVAVHSDRGTIDSHGRQVIAAASLIAGADTAVVVAVIGDLGEDLASAGADLVIACPLDGWNPEAELAFLLPLIDHYQPRHLLLPDNAIGDGDLGRRLAARLKAEVAAHVVEIRPDGLAAYWQGGTVMARRALPRVLLLDPETTDPALPFLGLGERLADVPVPGAQGRYQDLGLKQIKAAELPLEEADFIVSAGNGVANVKQLETLADAFGAAVGASRVAVDDGKFPRTKQIGATGKTVNASVYMAVGISGAVQHLQGIRNCRHVIAINTDASAPIAKRADLTVVADAGEVMARLLDRVAKRNWPGQP